MKRLCNQRGFTLVELVIVIIILGIMAAVAIPRVDFTSHRAPIGSDVVVSDIMSTQIAAMSQHKQLSITMVTNSPTYQYSFDVLTAIGTARDLTEVDTNLKIGTGQVITFNSLGEPVGLLAPATITVTDGTTTKSITIQPYTGKLTVL